MARRAHDRRTAGGKASRIRSPRASARDRRRLTTARIRTCESSMRTVEKFPTHSISDPQSAKGVEAELSDVGFVPGQFTQAIADAGSSGALYSALWIKTTQPTYFEHVQIATSDDRRTWTVVVQNALIYRVELTDRGTNEVPYGPSRARWIRVRILNGSRQFPIPAIEPISGSSSRRNSFHYRIRNR